jgi:predicted RNase H-like HicB family nuclease
MSHTFAIETEQETDGRWLAEIPELPGVMVYGDSKEAVVRSVYALALRVLADKVTDNLADAPNEMNQELCFACAR